MWVVNSAGVEALRLSGEILDGIERDGAGRPTGRLWRLDGWLRERLTSTGPPDLVDLSQELAAFGVTGVTDATPGYDDSSARALESSMVQTVLVLGAPYGNGPVKVVLPDHQLPSLDDLVAAIADARPRAVALHCVTVASLVLALTALDVGGSRTGDRIEHAAVCPPVLSQRLALMGIQVVTQPSLVLLRGDDYLEGVDEIDSSSLWPYASLLEAGVGVGCSTDSPYGSLDPWLAIAAATSRLTTSGRVLGATERVSAATALRGFLSSALAPGGPAREVAVGAPADLVLMDRPLAPVLADPSSGHVRCTMIEGTIVFDSAGVST
jgi:predicted amidohydrolase YtcJ